MKRRERITLMGVILKEIASASQEPGGARPTRLAMRTNLPYDRFQQLFEELQAKGLVTDQAPHALTDAGRDLLKKYKGLNDALRELGLADPASTHES